MELPPTSNNPLPLKRGGAILSTEILLSKSPTKRSSDITALEVARKTIWTFKP